MQVPCRIHASPTRNPCRTHADLTQNQHNTHAESTQKPRRIHANHTRIRALLFCCIRSSTCHHSFRRLLRSRVATQIRSGVSGQAARNASSKAFRSSFRSRSMRAATTASGPPRRSSSKQARNEEQVRLPLSPVAAATCAYVILGSSRKLRRPRRGYEGLGYETGYETGMKRV